MKNRLPFLDVMRGLTVLWMIETHIVNVGLSLPWKTGPLYHLLYMSNGFVAPSFVFCTGAGFWFATPKIHFWKYLRRLGFLLGVGYGLNLDAGLSDFQRIAQCDILHAIVLASFIALVFLVVSRRPEKIHWIFTFLALLVFLSTPLVWSASWPRSLPLFLAMPLSPIPPSKFPIFPWMGYLFAGISVTGFLMNSRSPKIFAATLAGISLAVPSLIFYIKEMNFTYPGMSGPYAEWYPSPGHSLFRLSGIMLVFSLFYLVNNRLKISNGNRIIRFLQINGQESLFMYVSHILLVYGTAWTIGLRDFFPERLNPYETVAAFSLITILCFSAASLINRSTSKK